MSDWGVGFAIGIAIASLLGLLLEEDKNHGLN
jgi:hypothetical protein